MPQKREVLALLLREELVTIVEQYELEVRDRRKRDDLVEAVGASRKATLGSILPDLARDRLKELCRALALDDSGREKSTLVDRLVGREASPSSTRAATVDKTAQQTALFKDEEPTPSKAGKSEPPTVRQRPRGNGGSGPKKNGGDLGFEATLWQAADKLRNNLDAAEYKHVVLGLIFLKYISDAFLDRYKQLELEIQDGADPEDPDEYRANNVFWVPQEARWEKVQANAKKPNVGKVIDDAMTAIERENPSLRGVLAKNYARPQLDKQRLGELIDLIATIGLGDAENRSKDILGRVYEYFLSEFASAEGKKGGQFYTPRCVVQVLVEMLAPYKGRVYDPCCGSGGMFVQSEKFIEQHGGRLGDISIYGQESNPTTWRLAKMNLAIRGIDADLGSENADSFHRDLHPDLKADFVLANPPFNDSDWGGDRLREDVRWKYGTPPAANANFAWVQHFVHHLSPKGMAGFVLANGSMSSNQSGEGEIRKAMVEADLVDCMVALPGQLFYSTQIPACLWFLSRNKGNGRFRDRRGETLFIDARKLGTMIDRTHRVFTAEDVARIAGTYHAWRGDPKAGKYEDVPGLFFSARKEDIEKHGFVLTPGRHVGAEEEEEDGEPLADKLARLTAKLEDQFAVSAKLEKVIRMNLARLGHGG
jgi:type I restriction enzyme M protein